MSDSAIETICLTIIIVAAIAGVCFAIWVFGRHE
jgi:flagellar basal body-associated protein FliL